MWLVPLDFYDRNQLVDNLQMQALKKDDPLGIENLPYDEPIEFHKKTL